MPKHNGKGSNKGKGPERTTYMLEQKFFACKLKKSGKKLKEILRLFKEKYGLEPKRSTLATFYNPDNMERYEKIGSRDTSMASVETHINKTQRPTIMSDMEFALLSMLKKEINIGSVVTKVTLKKMGKSVFSSLRALLIYDDSGERFRSLSDLNEEHMKTLCNDEILPCLAALLEHLKDSHNAEAEQTGRSTPEKASFDFTASNGWVNGQDKTLLLSLDHSFFRPRH